jgi:hypothetical protein
MKISMKSKMIYSGKSRHLNKLYNLEKIPIHYLNLINE